jgi:hypothetical protein
VAKAESSLRLLDINTRILGESSAGGGRTYVRDVHLWLHVGAVLSPSVKDHVDV